MKKFCFVMVMITVIGFASYGFAAETKVNVKADELKRMGVFLSNFTELGFFDFDTESLSPKDLIQFGIRHNYINNYKSRIAQCKVKGCEYGSLTIDGKFVAESLKKYFAIDFKDHGSTMEPESPSYYYDGKLYHFEGADGEATYYARVKEVFKGDAGVLRMTGELYNADDEESILGTFEAFAKPYKYGENNTWSFVSMTTSY